MFKAMVVAGFFDQGAFQGVIESFFASNPAGS